MIFNKHSHLEGLHAFLSASKYHWVNYSEDRLIESFNSHLAAQKGTELHDFASKAIRLRQNLPEIDKTLNLYVNDAIGFKMDTEQTLYYSPNCFGTADAISFRRKLLRIHDLKTGVSTVKMTQLIVYAALFCLEYKQQPQNIKIELRMYQKDMVQIYNPEPEEIINVMNKIILFDGKIEAMKLGEE